MSVDKQWIAYALCAIAAGTALVLAIVNAPSRPSPPSPTPVAPTPTAVDLPGQGRAYILCDGGNRVYFGPDGGVAVTLDRNECP